MPLLAEEIPEDDREFLHLVGVEADGGSPLFEEVLLLAHRRDTGKVTLHVGAEYRHAGIGEAFRENLQRHRLAGAGRARHQAMAVGVFEVEILSLVDRVVRFAARADIDLSVLEHSHLVPHCNSRNPFGQLVDENL